MDLLCLAMRKRGERIDCSETDLFISYDDKEAIGCPPKNIIGVCMKEVNTEEQQGSSKFSWSLKTVRIKGSEKSHVANL